jgi:predicted ABC-type ATPase
MNSTDPLRILVFAGPNGSGKSSVTSAWQIVGLYINADEIKKKRSCTDLEAAEEAEYLRKLCLAERRSFTFETVLSTDRNLDLLKCAKAAGYVIEGVFVLTASVELNIFRVKAREFSGGHSVPPEKIRSRYAKALVNVPHLLALCDVFRTVDNTITPQFIYVKDETGEIVRPNRYWSAEKIERLVNNV